MKRRAFLQLGLAFLAGCAVPTPTPHPTATRETPLASIPPAACRPGPWTAPTRPANNPSLDELDANGLHVVNASRAVEIDPLTYRLKISGAIENPLELSLDDLRCMPRLTATVNLTCKGNFEDVTTYSGVPLTYIFGLVSLRESATTINLIGADGYPGFVSKEDALDLNNFLAYQWKEEPLPIFHGFPVRAVLPAKLGYAWTKYLIEIRVE